MQRRQCFGQIHKLYVKMLRRAAYFFDLMNLTNIYPTYTSFRLGFSLFDDFPPNVVFRMNKAFEIAAVFA